MAVLDELQVAEAVRSCVELSEKFPVALNCWAVPAAILGLTGVTEIDVSVAGVTFNVVVANTTPDVAVIVAEPTDKALAFPAAVTVAMDAADELQVTELVMFWVVLSENVPVAVNC